jgi:hypothetical protein
MREHSSLVNFHPSLTEEASLLTMHQLHHDLVDERSKAGGAMRSVVSSPFLNDPEQLPPIRTTVLMKSPL